MYCHYNDDLIINPFKQQYERFYDYFSPNTFFREFPYAEVPRDSRPAYTSLIDDISRIGERIERYYKKIDFQKVREIADKRDKFIFKLFEHLQPIDIGSRAFKCRRNFNLSSAREIL